MIDGYADGTIVGYIDETALGDELGIPDRV